jgi:hypothetical protein
MEDYPLGEITRNLSPFLFFGVFFFDKFWQSQCRLPSLRVDGYTTHPKHGRSRNKIAYGIQRLRIKNRGKYDRLKILHGLKTAQFPSFYLSAE